MKSKRFWIGLFITIVTLYLAFQGIQFDKLLEALSHLNYLYLPLALLAFWVSYAGRVFRWQLLFSPYPVRWIKTLGALCVGYFLSNIFPARIGDVVRAYLIGRTEHVPVPHALSTVVVERTFDGLTVVLFLIVLLPIIPDLPGEARTGGILLGMTGLFLLAGLAILSRHKARGVAFLKRLTTRSKFLQAEGLWRSLEHLIDGFAVLRSPREMLGVTAWSVEIWVFAATLNWIVMRSIGIDLQFTAGMLVVVVTALAVTAAPTPGQLGVFHLATQFALTSVYGVDKSLALAYAFVIHAYVYIWLMALGGFFILHEGLDIGRIERAAVVAEAPQ